MGTAIFTFKNFVAYKDIKIQYVFIDGTVTNWIEPN